MKNYIIIEKDKAFSQLLYDNIVKKQVISKEKLKVKKTPIEELSSPNLFQFSNSDELVINKIVVGKKEQLEYLKNKISQNNISDLFISSESRIIIINAIDSDILRLIKNNDFNSHNTIIVSPFVIDKVSVSSFVNSYIRDISVDHNVSNISKASIKEKSRIILDKVNNNYGLLVPFFNLMSTNKDIFDYFINCNNDKLDSFVGRFIVSIKQKDVFLWDWKQCFSLKDYSDFVDFLHEISSRYGAVVLFRYMSKELSTIVKLKTLVDAGVPLSRAISMLNVRNDYRFNYIMGNVSLETLVDISDSLLYHYDSLMNNSFNSSVVVDSLFTSMWRLVQVD